mgnify:CR=1 FL=1
MAAKHGVRMAPSIADALTLGTDKLAVDVTGDVDAEATA